jgi:glycosyltransferase involved in cell wall biosynthesis
VGGPHRSLVQAMGWLAERGSVDFVVPEPGAAATTYGELGPVAVGRYGALVYARGTRERLRLARGLIRDVRTFRHELRRRRPDVVIAVTTVLPAVVVAARLERVRSVVYAAEVYAQDWKGSLALRLWGTLLAGATASLADGVVCCSQTVADQFRFASRRTRLEVAYPPIGEDYADGDRRRGRERYGLGDTRPVIAVVGNLSRGRGQDVALRALPLVRRSLPEARLLVVGLPHPRPVDREYAAELRRLADELGVAGDVVFAPPTDAMADVYAAADVVVNPARFAEPFGRVAPEALVAGRPVVASRVGALPEVIRDGVDGLLVAPDDPAQLAAAVIRCIDDPDAAARMVESGRRRVRERFGHEQDLAAWTAVLESALA